MTAAEILAQATRLGFAVRLNSTGDGLILWPGDDAPNDLVALLKASKPNIVAALQAERGRINRWIADRLIDWPQDNCLHCRKPINAGQLWAVVSNGEVTARFHEPCHGEWLAQQEVTARRVLGLAP